MRLEVIYDFLGDLQDRARSAIVGKHARQGMPPIHTEYTKTPPQMVDALRFFGWKMA